MKTWKLLLLIATFGFTVLVSCDNVETPDEENETITKITHDTTGTEADKTSTPGHDTIPADTIPPDTLGN